MQRRALLIAGASTLAGALLLRLHLARAEQRISGGARTDVLVLRTDLDSGSPVTAEALSVRGVPEAYLESRHIPSSKRAEVLDARVGLDVRAGEALLWTDLEGMRERARQLAALVPEGMRAVAIRSGGLDSLLRPGDRVDVLATPQDGSAATSAEAVRTVAQNALVLAVGEDLGGPADSAPSARHRGDRVTLSLTPAQSRRVAASERDHALRLVLRNPDDLALTDDAAGAAAIVTRRSTP